MHKLTIVCGAPAVGKSTHARELAARTGAVLLDSDTVTDRMIQTAHRAAGLDPYDRDSALYKATYREAVYETLFDIAVENLPHSDVIIAGPFTTERQDQQGWRKELEGRFGCVVEIVEIVCDEETRLRQMRERNAPRDAGKF